MKKFIKKTIAGLIAGVMAVSSMPFTALAGDSYNAKPATSFNAKKGTATVYWDQSSDKNCTGHYNNLLYFNSYSQGIDGSATADTGGNNCYTRAWYPTMVFLYDGVNDSYAPVMGTAAKSDWTTSRYLNYFVPMDNNDSNNLKDSSNFYCDNWIGSNGGTLDYTWTLDPSNRHHGVRASITDTTSSIFGLSRNTFYPHSSKLRVRNTVSFEGNEGYSHAQKIWWFAGSHTSNGKAPASGDKNFCEARKTTYVVNYKPLYDTAKEVAEQLKTFNETKYTVASVNAYYTAINAMYNFDPNSYFTNISEADVETKVNDCAKAIKKCVDDYTTAKANLEYKIVLKFADGTTKETSGKDGYVLNTEIILPKNSKSKTNNDGTHIKYSWDGVTGTVIDGSVLEFSETATRVNCTDDGTGKCKDCGYVFLDTSALDSAKAKAENILTVGNADGKYVKDTYQNLSDVYNRIKNVVPTTEDEVNSLAAELLTAISSLISSSVTITFTKSQNKTQVGETQTITKKYGDTAELTVSDADVEKWEIVNNKGAENEVRTFVKTGQNTLSIVVSKDISVIAHLAENVSSQQKITKVVFMGRNNAVVAIKYIGEGELLKTAGVPVPTIPFYKDGVWDKTEVTGLANGGVITVRAKYTFNGTEDDKCGIHYDGFENKVRKYNYDSFVKLYNSSEYFGMYEDEARTKLLTYFKTDEFYAPHNPNIYVAPVDASAVTASVGVTGSYQENYDTKDVAAFNCKFFVPDNAQIVEWGIKANAGGTTYNLKSNNKTSRNEYTFKVTVAKSTNISSVSAKAYIIYIDGAGKRTTLLSNNEVAIDFN